MKKTIYFVTLVALAVGVAIAQDKMKVALKTTTSKGSYVKMVKSKNLGKKLNLKVKNRIAKTRQKTKIKDLLANVEYNTDSQKKKADSDFFTELKDLSDLDKAHKYESKFIKAEGQRAKARRQKKKSQPFVAVNLGSSANEKLSLSEQAGKNYLSDKPRKASKGVVQGSVPGTSFDTFNSALEEEQAASEPIIQTQPKSDSEDAISQMETQATVQLDQPKKSLLSLVPMGGYGVMSLTEVKDNSGLGPTNWEASDSFVGGVMADIGRGQWQFETGLVYLRNGIKREVNQFSLFGVGANYMEYIDRDYVAVPLVGIFNFISNSTASVFAKAGLWPMYLNSARQEIYTYSISGADIQSDVSNLQQRWQVLATVGFGSRIHINSTIAFLIEADFMRGLSDTFNTPLMNGITQGFMGHLGLAFDIF